MICASPKVNLLFALLVPLVLSGCSAKHYSIHRINHLDSNKSAVIAVDAKQRFVLSNTRTGAGPGALAAAESIRRYCAEPSPDVFSVLSQAASGSGSFGQKADPTSVNVALQAAFSSSETGSTISRSQTINMLKEMMYRTCERYLNGQISELEYPIIAARDQRIMTSILAIEQLTGGVLQKPVVIGGGNASAGANSETEQARFQAIKDVADVVERIVSRSFVQEDETLFFCYRALSPGIQIDPQVAAACLALIDAKIENDTVRLQRETNETRRELDQLNESLFNKFWNKIRNASDRVDKGKLKAVIDNKLPGRHSPAVQNRLSEMNQKDTRDEIRTIFNGLPSFAKDKLSED